MDLFEPMAEKNIMTELEKLFDPLICLDKACNAGKFSVRGGLFYYNSAKACQLFQVWEITSYIQTPDITVISCLKKAVMSSLNTTVITS